MRIHVHQEQIEIPTKGRGFLDITRAVERAVLASGIQTGTCSVFVHHTSASLLIQENADPSVLRDLERWMSKHVPDGSAYEHGDEGPDDMPGHIRSMLTHTSEVIPITNGRPALGTWQALYLWEHRHRPHIRRLTLTSMGTQKESE